MLRHDYVPVNVKSETAPRLPRPCPCVLCRDRAGNLTWHPELTEIKIPAPPVSPGRPRRRRRDKSGAPSRIKMRKGWASAQCESVG